MKIKQFRYASDNLGYLIYGKKDAVAVDGGAVGAILSFLETERIGLKFVTNTHSHADHTMGNRPLMKASDADYLDHKILSEKGGFELEGRRIVVYPTPGHTMDAVTFHFEDIVVTGDTLFNGTVGNCFSNDLRRFFKSIQKLLSLPGETVVYAGHDYVKDAMAVAKRIEPDNADIDRFLAAYSPNHVRSIVADERRINPYVRYNEPGIISFLEGKGLPVATEYERWKSIMSID